MEGLIYKSTGSRYVVKDMATGTAYDCRIKGCFRLGGTKNTNPIAVDDRVTFEVEEGAKGVTAEIKPRDNYIMRCPVNLSRQTHIIASNINLAFLVVILSDPLTSTTLIDRFLIATKAYGIKTILPFNKIDTYNTEEIGEVKFLVQLYHQAGYECIGISAATGKNVDKVMTTMEGKTCMVSGHLGSGKSTLINAVDPELHLKTVATSEQHLQGWHTITFAGMFGLPSGARIIDTPGIRGFGMVEIEKEEPTDYFSEFFALEHHCKFHNCLHTDEPQCAIKEVLEEGAIAWSCYKSYLQTLNGEEDR